MTATRPGVHGLQCFDVDPFLELLHLFTLDVGSQELLKSGHLLVKVGFQVLVPHEVDVGVAPLRPSSLENFKQFSKGSNIFCTTLLIKMNAKLGQKRLMPCLINGLIKKVSTLSRNLFVTFKSASNTFAYSVLSSCRVKGILLETHK